MFGCVMFYLNWGILVGKKRELDKDVVEKEYCFDIRVCACRHPLCLVFQFSKALWMKWRILSLNMSIQCTARWSMIFWPLQTWVSAVHFSWERKTSSSGYFLLHLLFILFLMKRIRENVLVVVWALASVMYVISHREFFGTNFLMVLPPFSLWPVYGIARAMGPGLKWRQIFTVEVNKAIIIFAVMANLFFYTTFVHMHYTKFLFLHDREHYEGGVLRFL